LEKRLTILERTQKLSKMQHSSEKPNLATSWLFKITFQKLILFRIRICGKIQLIFIPARLKYATIKNEYDMKRKWNNIMHC
jgi:hypothetical protein